MKAIKEKLLYAAAIILSVFYCIEVFTNGKPNTLNWIGIVIAAVIVIAWLINIGIYISRKNREIEAKKALKAQKEAEKAAKKGEEPAENSN